MKINFCAFLHTLFKCKKSFKQAFSLIELLVSLIIIALLLTAFIPLITKKLRVNDTTMGSFGNDILDSQQDCDRLGAGLLFISKDVTKTKNMCVMKYNIGDTGIENWSGVQRCAVGDTSCNVENGTNINATEDILQPACWQGKTAGRCNSAYGGYSGCNRTICNWTGANRLCENYRLGTYGWRLPEKGEILSFANETYSNKSKKSDGLMFCDHVYNSTSAPICEWSVGLCTGTTDNNCNPHGIWSYTIVNNNRVYTTGLQGSWGGSANAELGRGFSARCVLDEDAFKHAFTNKVMPSETELNNVCNDSGCALCSKDKCYVCKKGYELNGKSCVISINNCEEITNGKCSKCKNNLLALNGKCVSCSTQNGLIKVGNICVMQYNIGDGRYGENFNGVQTCYTGQSCAASASTTLTIYDSLPTCWKGITGDMKFCNSDFGGYSGCTRTVCNWTGADKMCSNIGWRLPTIAEVKTLEGYSSKSLGANGLMFCDSNETSTLAPKCGTGNGCKRQESNYNTCGACHVWSSNLSSDKTKANSDPLIKNYWYNAGNLNPIIMAATARCVKDL